MAKTKAAAKAAASPLGIVTKENLESYTARSMRDYGAEVVEQRAIPDYRDGLKPVHRCLLWSMYKLGIHHDKGFKKAARIVGDTLGQYHPHGDASCYQALVGMTGTKNEKNQWATKNASVPLVEGYGNWGDFIDSAAAYRYTECRLSRFSDLLLLDPNYLAVTDMVPNFSEDSFIPIILPAKLPVALLNGSSSIAVGVAASCPSFGMKGVVKLVQMALKGRTITSKLCLRYLQFNPTYGGECVSPDEEIIPMLKDGKGSVQYLPTYEVDKNKNEVIITSVCPGLTSSNSLETMLTKVSNLKGVRSVVDDTNRTGVRYVVNIMRNVTGRDFDKLVLDIEDVLLRSERYDIGITIRDPKGGAKFQRASVPQIITMWTQWRIELEIKVVKHLISVHEGRLARQQLLLLAVDNIKIIMDSLKHDDSAAYLVKTLKITLEQANSILDMKVRQLKALERKGIVEAINKLKQQLKDLNADLKAPAARVLLDLAALDKTLGNEMQN